MTTTFAPSDLPAPLIVRRATPRDREVLERLWLLFRHEMSAFSGALPKPDGSYPRDRLDAGLTESSWSAWLLTAADHPVGFALVRAVDEPVCVLNSFFLVSPARRRGIGTHFASSVIAATPGAWAIAYQDDNVAAAGFWPGVAARFDPDWRLEHRPVPGRSDRPPDAWVTFRAPKESPSR